MKILLISGREDTPAALDDILARGSTVMERKRVSEVDPGRALDSAADRVVFWSASGDDLVSSLAADCAARARPEDRHAILFVAADDRRIPEGLSANEVFVWPRDEDRLRMTFMTGA